MTAERSIRFPWLYALPVVAAAVIARCFIDFASPLMPKVNGAYYLVQVRTLLETGRLAFTDFPLLFVIESLLARVIGLFGAGSSEGIMLSVKLVDVALPPLAAVAMAALVTEWRGADDTRWWPAIVAAAFAVISSSPLFMTGDFQKNALGMVCMAGMTTAGHRAMKRGGAGLWIATGLWCAFAGLCHAGAFAATVALAALIACIRGAGGKRGRATIIVAVVTVVAAVVVLGAVLRATDRVRFGRMTGVLAHPLSLFRDPILLSAFRAGTEPLTLLNALFVSVVAVIAFVMLVRRWKETSLADRSVVAAAAVLAFLLASPLIGSAWSERLSLMAYLPGSAALGFLLTRGRRKAFVGVAAAVTCAFCAASLALFMGPLGRPSIPVESLAELHDDASLIEDPGRTLVIARHGLEWWAAWTLRTKVAQEYDLAPSVWSEYAAVYMLVEKPPKPNADPWPGSAGGPPGPGRQAGRGPSAQGGQAFPEVRIPDDAEIVHEGAFFLLSGRRARRAFIPWRGRSSERRSLPRQAIRVPRISIPTLRSLPPRRPIEFARRFLCRV